LYLSFLLVNLKEHNFGICIDNTQFTLPESGLFNQGPQHFLVIVLAGVKVTQPKFNNHENTQILNVPKSEESQGSNDQKIARMIKTVGKATSKNDSEIDNMLTSSRLPTMFSS
jgi:hypothetical protein